MPTILERKARLGFGRRASRAAGGRTGRGLRLAGTMLLLGAAALVGGGEGILLKRPRGYEPGRTYPLVVALHGNGGSAAGLSRVFDAWAALPVLVALPQGAYPRPGGGYSWFLPTPDRSLWAKADEHALDLLLAGLAEARRREPVGKVVILGFSQGASLAYLAGLRNPGLVDGIAAVAGNLPGIGGEGSILRMDHVAKARRVAVFLARGLDDPLVGREAFLRQKTFFEERGYRIEAVEFEGGHRLTGPLLDRIWEWIERRVPQPRASAAIGLRLNSEAMLRP
jgi:predicted esterase